MSHVGIDFDTHAVHLVKLEETSAAVYIRCELVGLDAFERTRHIRQAMPSSAFWDDVVACAIEEPQGAQKATVAKLKAVQGAILACLPRTLLVEPMVPARWRTAVGLGGNVRKEEVWYFVNALRLGEPWIRTRGARGERLQAVGWTGYVDIWDQDACDAYCLALAVSRLVETEAV